jgi:hypothetical protein
MKDDKYRSSSQCVQSEVTYITTITPHQTLQALTQCRLTTLYVALQCTLLKIRDVLLFSLQRLFAIFLIIRREWDTIKKKYIGLHVKYPYSLVILMKLEFPRQIFEKYSNIKFNNLSSGSRVVPGEKTNGWTDTTKLIVPFRNSANAPRNIHVFKFYNHLQEFFWTTRNYKHVHCQLSNSWFVFVVN